MAREILPETTVPQTATNLEQAAAKTPLSMPPIAPFGGESHRDALAGAFPEWDLVPAVPFVRRVK